MTMLVGKMSKNTYYGSRWDTNSVARIIICVTYFLLLLVSVSPCGKIVHAQDVSTDTILERIYSQDDIVSDLEHYINNMSVKHEQRYKCGSKAVINKFECNSGGNNNTKLDISKSNLKSDEESVTQTTDTKGWPPWPTLKEEEIKTAKDRIYFTKYKDLPKRSSDCDNVQLPSFDYTIVTALIDLRREEWPRFKRQFIKYLYYAARMLDFHAPMVIYVEKEAVDFVEYHRQGKEHITRIVPVSLRDLEYYRYYDRIEEIMESDVFKEGHRMLHHPEGFSPDYNILMNSKMSILYDASVQDYFQTRYIYWMDVGYGHGNAIYPKTCYWSPWSIMNGVNQVTYIQLNPLKLLTSVHDVYKKFVPPFMNGAFFGGPKMAMKRYYFLHKEVFEDFLDHWMVDDDQTLALACYFQKSILFNVVKGWWYDVFELFK